MTYPLVTKDRKDYKENYVLTLKTPMPFTVSSSVNGKEVKKFETWQNILCTNLKKAIK